MKQNSICSLQCVYSQIEACIAYRYITILANATSHRGRRTARHVVHITLTQHTEHLHRFIYVTA